MRCTRCDRIAVPQAVGVTPEGLLAYGWCVACLEQAGCTGIKVASRRPRGIRRSRRRLEGPGLLASISLETRRRGAVGWIAAGMAFWALALMVGGALIGRHGHSQTRSPLGNGSPALLLVGGGVMGLASVVLWASAFRPSDARPRVILWWVRWAGWLAAFAVLLAAVLGRSPGRAPFVAVAGFVSFALIAVRRLAVELAVGRRDGPLIGFDIKRTR